MEEEEERVHFEEEEVTTIHRKTIRTRSTTRRKKQTNPRCSSKDEIKLSPYIHGTKNREPHQPGTPELARKPDRVQKLVHDTLNEYKGSQLPQIKCANRVFLGAFESDEEDDEIEDITGNTRQTSELRVWRFQKSGKQVPHLFKYLKKMYL